MALVKRVDKVHGGVTVTYDSTVSGEECVALLGSFGGILFEGSSTPAVPVNGGISWWFKGSVNSPLEVDQGGMSVGMLAYSAVGNLMYMVMLVGLSAEGFGIGIMYMPDESSQEEGLLEGVLVPYGEEFSLGWSWSATAMQVWLNGELVFNKSHSTSWAGVSFSEGWGADIGSFMYIRSLTLSEYGVWTRPLSGGGEMSAPLSVTTDCLLSFRGVDVSSEGSVVTDGVMFYPGRPVSGYLGVGGDYSACGLAVMTPGSEVSVSEGGGPYDVWYYDPADSAPVKGLEFRCLSPAEGDRELEVRSSMGVFDVVPEGLSVSLEALGGGAVATMHLEGVEWTLEIGGTEFDVPSGKNVPLYEIVQPELVARSVSTGEVVERRRITSNDGFFPQDGSVDWSNVIDITDFVDTGVVGSLNYVLGGMFSWKMRFEQYMCTFMNGYGESHLTSQQLFWVYFEKGLGVLASKVITLNIKKSHAVSLTMLARNTATMRKSGGTYYIDGNLVEIWDELYGNVMESDLPCGVASVSNPDMVPEILVYENGNEYSMWDKDYPSRRAVVGGNGKPFPIYVKVSSWSGTGSRSCVIDFVTGKDEYEVHGLVTITQTGS